MLMSNNTNLNLLKTKSNVWAPVELPDSTLIVISQGVDTYKLSKITLHHDGGFNLHVPYHTQKHGYISKFEVDYRQTIMHIGRNAIVEEYSVSSEVKLSIHRSGFVQFSGPKIRSGIERFTNSPKGMAIQVPSLETPIRSGPTFGITAWGLDEFVKYGGKPKKGEQVLLFTEAEIFNSDDPRADGYLIEGFVFPVSEREHVVQVADGFILSKTFPHFEVPNTTFTFKVVLLKKTGSFLGIMVRKTQTQFGDVQSGYVLAGPSAIREPHIGITLMASYPKPFVDWMPSETLDRE